MPTFNDLYYTQMGYSLLKPEYTNQFNLGFSYQKRFRNRTIPSIYFQANAYYMDIKGKIMDLAGKHIKGIEIPNCRYIIFHDNEAYVSSYATPVSIDPNAGKGLIFEIDRSGAYQNFKEL